MMNRFAYGIIDIADGLCEARIAEDNGVVIEKRPEKAGLWSQPCHT